MSLYEKWQEAGTDFELQAEYDNYWKKYFLKEADNYRQILAEKQTHIEGTLTDLAKSYHMTDMEFVGFLDGINTSLKSEIDVEALTEESEISIDIDYEKLLFNMHAAKADWLYELEEWEDIFDEEKRKAIRKSYMQSKTVVKGEKIGRNDPCPCGSGKKYKKCCAK